MMNLKKDFLFVLLIMLGSSLATFAQTISASQTQICPSDSVLLSVEGVAITRWSNGLTSNTIVVHPKVTSTYTAYYFDQQSNATLSLSKTITVNPLPDATISGDLTVCPGQSTTLSAPLAQSYLWSNGAVTPSITVSPMESTDFWVEVTSASGCTNRNSVRVQVLPLPDMQISGVNQVCAGSGAYLSLPEGYNYFWNTGETTSSIYVSPQTTTSYSVTVTNDNGCSQVLSHVVSVLPAMGASIVGPTAPVCAGSSVNLSVLGGVAYSWSHGLGNQAIVSVAPFTTTTYYVTVNNEQGCSENLSYTVQVANPQAPTVTGALAICLGDSTHLVSTPANAYEWSLADGVPFATTPTVTLKPTTTTDYVLNVYNEVGCARSTPFRVVVNTIPSDLTIDGPSTVCAGESIKLSVSQTGYFYNWNTGQTTTSITVAPLSNTTYRCTVTNASGCSYELVKQITVVPKPQLSITGDSVVCSGSWATLIASGGVSYRWNTGDTTAAIRVLVNTPQIYTVSAANSHNCWATASHVVQVKVRPVPFINGVSGVCRGASAHLTASGGTSYRWSTGETTRSIDVSPSEATTYKVWAMNDGCESLQPAEHTVIVYDSIQAVIDGPTHTCQAFPVTLTAAGASQFLWNTGETTASIQVAPIANTTYTCKVYDINGCQAQYVQHTVMVDSIPALQVIGNRTICQGETTTLKALGADFYSWTGGTQSQADSIVVAPLQTTTYTLTGTNVNGCVATLDITVVVNDFDDVTIDGYTHICRGASTLLTVVGDDIVQYQWDNGAGTSSIKVTPNETTNYSVLVTNNNGCNKTLLVTVQVDDTIVPTIVGPSEICSGDVVQLTASLLDGTDAQQYIWSNGQTGKTINVNPTTSTTYTVTAVLPGGCSSTASHLVDVHTINNAIINGVNHSCPNRPVVLTATGGDTYLWNNGMTGSMITVFPDKTTLYEVTVTNAFGCTSIANHLVTVDPIPPTSIIGDTVICKGQTTTLVATGGVSYMWDNGSVTNSIVVAPAVTTNYHVLVTAPSGCDTTLYFTVKVIDLPQGDITGNFMICVGESTTLTATGGVSYFWSNGASGPSITETPNVTTNYSVVVTNANGCSQTISRSVVVNPLPVPVITGNTDICFGDAVTLTASGAGIGGYYIWSTGEQSPSITVNPQTTSTYSVVAVSRFGCQSKPLNFTVQVHTAPNVAIAGSRVICPGDKAILTAQGNAVRYLWSTGDTTASITVTTAGTYTLKGFSKNGCMSQSSVTVVNDNVINATVMASESYICAGERVTLTATGGDSYLWNTGDVTESIQVNPSTTTTYTVKVISLSGCQQILKITVNVNAITITGKDNICLGETVALTATGLSSQYYRWNTGDTTQTIQVSPNTRTTYTVNAYSPRGCDVYGSFTVDVYKFPTNLSIAGIDTICQGDAITLTAIGGSSGTQYLWSTGQKSASIVVRPSLTHDYWCRYTAGASCDTVLSHHVQVIPKPKARITAPTSICPGDSVLLMASGGSSYLWNFTNSTDAVVKVAPKATTTYRLVAFNANQCTDTTYHTITINNEPNVIVMGGNVACIGSPLLLVASDGTTTSNYQWSNGMQGDSIWVTLFGNDTLKVTCTNKNGCQKTIEHRITAYEMPIPSISGDNSICSGAYTTLTATGGRAYLWSIGSRSSSIRVAPTKTTTYWVDVIGQGNCTVRDSITVYVTPKPIPGVLINGDTIPVTSANLCRGESITLTGHGAGNNGSYSWRNTNSTFTANTQSITVAPSVSNYYYLTVTTAEGCTNVLTFRVNVYAPVNASITGNDTTCSNSPVKLSIYGAPTNASVYWNTGETTRTITVTPQITTTYNCQVTSSMGCDTVIYHTVFVNPSPNAAITAPTEICEGDVAVLIASGGDYYLWNNGITANRIAVRPTYTTTYSVQISNMNGCQQTLTHTIQVNPKPQVTIVGNAVTCFGDSVMLYATDGSSTTRYQWDNGIMADTIWVKPLADSTFTVIATSEYGCVDTAAFTIQVHTYQPLTIEGETRVCQGDGTTITIQGGIAWNWSTGATMQTVWLQPNTSTTYWVDVTSPGGCVERLMVPIDVLPTPQASVWLSGDLGASTYTTICAGHRVMLEGHGAGSNGSYKWMDALGNIVSTNQTVTVSPLQTTTYFLEVTSQLGCYHTTWFTVHVLPVTNMNLTASSTAICNGSSVTLQCGTPNDGMIYNWTTNQGLNFTGSSLVDMPTQTTTYYVTTTNASGCVSTDSVMVQVFPYASASITGPGTVCSGDTIRLTASAGNSYLWNNGATTQSILVQAYGQQYYSVEIINAVGCNAFADYTLNTFEPMNMIVTGDDTIYLGESTTLMASGARSYYWSNGVNASQITVAPVINTTYSVTGVDENGCTSTQFINVVVLQYKPTIIGNQTICLGESTTLTANSEIGSAYLWNTGENTQSITVSPTITTCYSVSVTTPTGARGVDSMLVTVLNPPVVVVDAMASVCQTDAAALFNCVTSFGNPVSYSLTFSQAAQMAGFPAVMNNVPLTDSSVEVALPNGIQPGIYSATIIFVGNDGCSANAIPLQIEVLKADMIVQKWNDVLICNNITHQYVAYQWYKNGTPIYGATMQYYSETGGFNGNYYVVAERQDGTKQKSCVLFLQTQSAARPLVAQPNPVERFHTLNLDLPYSADELTDAVIKIFDMTGKLIETHQSLSPQMQLSIPYTPGMYLLMVYLNDGTSAGIKFLVNE